MPAYLKDKIKFVKTAKETNGKLSVLEVEVSSGGGPPMHYHKTITQKFKIISGILYLTVAGKNIVLKAGDEYIVPPMVPHGEKSEAGKLLKCIVEISPGHKGYEEFMNMTYNAKGHEYNEEKLKEIYLNADTFMP